MPAPVVAISEPTHTTSECGTASSATTSLPKALSPNLSRMNTGSTDAAISTVPSRSDTEKGFWWLKGNHSGLTDDAGDARRRDGAAGNGTRRVAQVARPVRAGHDA